MEQKMKTILGILFNMCQFYKTYLCHNVFTANLTSLLHDSILIK